MTGERIDLETAESYRHEDTIKVSDIMGRRDEYIAERECRTDEFSDLATSIPSFSFDSISPFLLKRALMLRNEPLEVKDG